MKGKFKALCGFLILSAVMVSCGGSNNDNLPAAKDEILPLEVGNRWRYVVEDFDPQMKEVALDTTQLEISGKRLFDIDGKTEELFYWQWRNLDTGNYKTTKWLKANQTDGAWLYGSIKEAEQDTLIYPSLHIKYPALSGDVWYVKNSDNKFEEYSCKKTEYNLNTFYGDVTCNEYHYKNIYRKDISQDFIDFYNLPKSLFDAKDTKIYDFKTYYAPNIGYVGMKVYVNDELKWQELLLDFVIE